MDQAADPASSTGNTSSPPPPSTCGSGSSVGVAGDSMLVPVVLDDLTFDNRQVRAQTLDIYANTRTLAIANRSRISIIWDRNTHYLQKYM